MTEEEEARLPAVHPVACRSLSASQVLDAFGGGRQEERCEQMEWTWDAEGVSVAQVLQAALAA